MDDVVHKPFSIRALAESMSRLLPAQKESSLGAMPEMTPGVDQPAIPAVPAGPSGDHDGPLLDREVAAQLEDMAKSGQADFVIRVFNLYLQYAPPAGEEVLQAVAARDMERVARAAHALKSMSLNIGAIGVASRVAEMERQARCDGSIDQKRCEQLPGVLSATLDAIRDRLAGTAASHAPAPAESGIISNDLPPAARMDLIALERALQQGEFHLVYQPLVDRRRGHAIGVEALVRWHGGPSPGEFIPFAESSGWIRRLGEWVLLRACEEALGWPQISLAVNVSPLQLQQDSFP
jgi:two-component system, NarL family, sensor histidine kinase BarA